LIPGRVLITGAGGQLGAELRATAPRNWLVRAPGRAELDIRSVESVNAEVGQFQPAVIINAAAYTDVDRAESESSAAFAVNETGPANVAAAALACRARLVHVSTDFVFDGKRDGPPYAPSDPTGPLGVYGASKLAGERRVLESMDDAVIVRTAWLYSTIGRNFVLSILNRLRNNEPLRVVTDQVGSPTWARSLAAVLWEIAADDSIRGVTHWADGGHASRYDLAIAIREEALKLRLIASETRIDPISVTEYPLPAARPAYSVLDCAGTAEQLGHPQTQWRENLPRMMKELTG
jgi:dTDP-4-dehydrorhamnose reductase